MVEGNGPDKDADNADQPTPQHAVATQESQESFEANDREGQAVPSGNANEPRKIKRKPGRPKGAIRSPAKLTRREVADVVLQHVMGKTQAEISKRVGISQPAVDHLLGQFQPIFDELNNVDAYRAAQGKLLDATALRLLKSMNDKTAIDEAKIQHRAYTYDIIAKHSRLAQGLSTQNISSKTETFVKVSTRNTPESCD